MALSVHLFRSRLNYSWLSKVVYENLLDLHDNAITAIPDAMVVKPVKGKSKILMVENQILPGNVTTGNFKDIWWVCGNKAYIPAVWVDRMLLYGNFETFK